MVSATVGDSGGGIVSPCQRSLKKLRDAGYFVAVVEKWNAYRRIRQDLWGFADLLCIRENEALLIQTTSGSNVSHRLEKILGIDVARVWVSSPSRRIVVHGWSKRGPRGKRKLWTCREVEVGREMFDQLNGVLSA